MKMNIDKTTFTHQAGGNDLNISDAKEFLKELGEGAVYLNDDGVLVYLMEDGAFYAYHYLLEKDGGGMHYTKRFGFEGTEDAHARFIKAAVGYSRFLDPENNTKIDADSYEIPNAKHYILND
jgi:hypothetical protein